MRKPHLWALALLVVAGLVPAFAQATVRTITIDELQDPAKQALLGGTDTLITEGVATAYYCSGGGCGFFIEDPNLPAQYRGVLVFTGAVQAFVDSGGTIGDRIRVQGRWTEFNGETEIISQSGSSFGSPPRIIPLNTFPGVPAPLIVTTGDIAERSVTGEWYEGEFVQLDRALKVTNTRNLGAFNLAQAVNADGTAPGDTILIDTGTIPDPDITRPDSGVVITFTQGIFGQRGVPSPSQLRGYRLRVRGIADITFPAPPSVVSIYSVGNDSLRVVFDRALDPVTSQDVTKYSRATLKGINAAILQPHPVTGIQQIVVLTTLGPNAQTPAEPESVVVSGVKSSGGQSMPSPQGRAFLAGVIPIAQVQTPLPGEFYSTPEGSDTSQYVGKIVTVQGTVTLQDADLVWISDAAGGLRSGIKLFGSTAGMQMGDNVTIVGIPTEFFDETEFSPTTGLLFERVNGPGTMPPPIDIAAADINILNSPTPISGSAREDYEGVLIRVHDVAVALMESCFGNWTVKAGGSCWLDPACIDSVAISNKADNNYTYRPSMGSQLSSIMGPTEISNPSGSCYYALRIVPRQESDIVPGAVTSVEPKSYQLAIRAAGANPVSLSGGGAEFAFTLPERGAPKLALYDLRGRLVTTLTNGSTLEAGPHSARWDGTNADGHRVPSGVYFALLRLGERVTSVKVAVTE